MRQNILYVIFIVMIMSEKMFVVVDAFVFGYCLGYYSFEIFKYKNWAEEIHECFLRYKKNMADSVDVLTKKLELNQNSWRYFFWKRFAAWTKLFKCYNWEA